MSITLYGYLNEVSAHVNWYLTGHDPSAVGSVVEVGVASALVEAIVAVSWGWSAMRSHCRSHPIHHLNWVSGRKETGKKRNEESMKKQECMPGIKMKAFSILIPKFTPPSTLVCGTFPSPFCISITLYSTSAHSLTF